LEADAVSTATFEELEAEFAEAEDKIAALRDAHESLTEAAAPKEDLEALRAHKFREIPPLEPRAASYVPDEMINLTEGLLAKDPHERPAPASMVQNRLEVAWHEAWQRGVIEAPYRPGSEVVPDEREVSDSVEIDWEPKRDAPLPKAPLQPLLRFIFGEEPLMAPSTVVTYLAGILIILVVVVLYLVFPDFVQVILN
ncbi:MAG: hypothetical protein ABEL76_07225, partial [Bradymonadaceae bacterium]